MRLLDRLPRLRACPALLILLVLVASGCTTTIRTSASFDREAIRDLGLMPPEVQYFVRTATLTEARPERNQEVEAVLLQALENVLAQTEIRPGALGLTDSLLAAQPELALELTRARENAGSRADSIRAARRVPITQRVDPEVGRFADLADTDHLLFVRGTAYGSTGGATARDAAVAVASAILLGGFAVRSQKGLVLELLVVDANTAEVLWYNRTAPGAVGSDPLRLDAVERHLTTLLQPLIRGRGRE